jgi:hypothetical protein
MITCMQTNLRDGAHDVGRIAAAAECSAPTVWRYLAGGAVRPLSRLRIERALRRLRLGALARKGAA